MEAVAQTFGIEIRVTEDGKESKYSLNSDLNGEMTLQELLRAIKSALISIARDALRDEQALGFDKDPVTIVDNRYYKKIEDVSPLGKIQFISRAPAADVFLKVYEGIVSRSKRVTGTYANNNFVIHNGKTVARSQSELATWAKTAVFNKGDIVRFVNVTPYARRLESLGTTRRRKGSRRKYIKSKDKLKRSGEMVLGANGVYFLTHRAMDRAYGKNFKIYYRLISGSELGIAKLSVKRPDRAGNFRTTYDDKGPNKRKGLNPYVYPSIMFIVTAGSV